MGYNVEGHENSNAYIRRFSRHYFTIHKLGMIALHGKWLMGVVAHLTLETFTRC